MRSSHRNARRRMTLLLPLWGSRQVRAFSRIPPWPLSLGGRPCWLLGSGIGVEDSLGEAATV